MTTEKRKYGQNAVCGSLAYDFDNPELYREAYSTPARELQPHRQTSASPRSAVKTSARTRQGIAPGSILGLLVVGFLFFLVITSRAQLLELSSENVVLTDQLADLQEEQARLRVSYESAFNPEEIENYAVNELGMQKPNADQILYIDTSAADAAAVIASDSGETLADRVSDWISSFRSYFG